MDRWIFSFGVFAVITIATVIATPVLLTQNQQKIVDQQVQTEKNILGNLTAHRLVANFTRDNVIYLENKTLQNQEKIIALLENLSKRL